MLRNAGEQLHSQGGSCRQVLHWECAKFVQSTVSSSKYNRKHDQGRGHYGLQTPKSYISFLHYFLQN
jgi:hypothetical protein